MRGVTPLVLASVLLPAALGGQTQLSVAEHLALGDSAHAALAPAQALQHYRAALAIDSTTTRRAGRRVASWWTLRSRSRARTTPPSVGGTAPTARPARTARPRCG